MTKLVCCYAQEISILDYDSGTMKEDKQTGFLNIFFLINHIITITKFPLPVQNAEHSRQVGSKPLEIFAY